MAVRWMMRPRTQEGEPSRTGSPLGSSDQPPSAKRSMPRVAKRADTSTWAAARKLTTSVSASASGGHDEDEESMEKVSTGGSAETEITEVAVNPCSRPACAKVTTATPAGGCRKTDLRGGGVTGPPPSGGA